MFVQSHDLEDQFIKYDRVLGCRSESYLRELQSFQYYADYRGTNRTTSPNG